MIMRLYISVLLFLLPLQLYCINSDRDTITFNNPLKDGDLLVSGDGTFLLGFFSPGKSTNRYVGIWYNKISEQTVVWVANRDNPLTDSSGILSLDRTRNLILTAANFSGDIWSTNVSTSGNRLCYTKLLDSGNLVFLHDEKIVWQSFDHPTDTTIPYLKIGVDKKTNMNWFLTSWKSRDDPGTGEFMFKMDLTELPEIILHKGQKRLWRTGPWIGGRWIGIPQMMTNSFFLNSIYVNNQDEASVTNTLKTSSPILTRMVVNESGVLQRLTWHEPDQHWFAFMTFPADKCDYYDKCGSYGYCDPQISEDFECTCLPGFEPSVPRDWFLRDGSAGCVRKKGLAAACDTGRDGFFKLEKAKLPVTGVARVHRSIAGVDACGEECRKNCTCTAYASGGAADGGECITWHGELVDTRVFTNGGWDLYVRVNALELAKYSNTQSPSSLWARSKIVAYIGASISTLLVIIMLIICSFFAIKRRKDRKRKECETSLVPTNCSSNQCSPIEKSINDGDRTLSFDERKMNANLHLFDFNTIVKATNNFSTSNTLGEGGFGVVYKGQLRNGKTIAVKRLATNSNQGVEEFKNEVSLIAELQHINLVKLLGCCVQQHEKMLIYEYLSNKGLDSFIFDKEKGSLLNWENRFRIILGIARGLIYLHHDSRLKIIHRDLKASNILLDDEMNSKISDFGMARIFGRNQMEENTKRIVGTYGYMSPEYAMRGLFSIKSDAFSFGVILLELISGRKNNNYQEDTTINLIGHIWNLWNNEKSLEIIDPSMGDSCIEEQVLRCIHVGLLCVQELAIDRPNMLEVAFMLSNEMTLSCPKQPPFIFNDQNKSTLDLSTSDGTNSINGLTITQMNGR